MFNGRKTVGVIRNKFSQMDIPETVMDKINYEMDRSERNLTEWKNIY